ncbi:hypothetical protein GXB85_04150 [Cellulomonas sp. APG4]|uniref:hypothetical protein n=1 Tax=Cellulomonas sp. APG4 TaxID=1538656 RepID=UPI00137B71CE|nr:hypothetical protein [Cellulomonas sp. APG4]NCT90145.1 hypothetical protein [Cellulomonas sp. APG4]
MDLDFKFDCPECGRSVKATVAEVGRQATKRCPNGHSIKLVDKGGDARRAQSAMDDLERSLKRFGRR